LILLLKRILTFSFSRYLSEIWDPATTAAKNKNTAAKQNPREKKQHKKSEAQKKMAEE